MKRWMILACCALLWNCQSFESPEEQASEALEQLESLVSRIDLQAADYDQEEWAVADSLFGVYLAESSRDDGQYLTEEQKKTLGKLSGKYAAIRIQHSAKLIEDQLEEAGIWLEGFVEGVLEEMNSEEDQ